MIPGMIFWKANAAMTQILATIGSMKQTSLKRSAIFISWMIIRVYSFYDLSYTYTVRYIMVSHAFTKKGHILNKQPLAIIATSLTSPASRFKLTIIHKLLQTPPMTVLNTSSLFDNMPMLSLVFRNT